MNSLPLRRSTHRSFLRIFCHKISPLLAVSLFLGVQLTKLSSAEAAANLQQADTGVRFVTNLGTFDILLLPEVAPKTVENFLTYVNEGAYNGTHIHRLAKNFVVQGGGFSVVQSDEGLIVNEVLAHDPVDNEFNLSNVRGTVAMAKLGGNPNSATNQFFVNLGDNSANLDTQNEGFTVFARVTGNGMEVIDAINNQSVWDGSNFLHPAFDSLPLINFTGNTELRLDHFVAIQSATAFKFDFLGLPPGEGLRNSIWFGTIDDKHFNRETGAGWINHSEHGWLYATDPSSSGSMWLWDHLQQDWLWTTADIYPFFFRHNEGEGFWLYYKIGGNPGAREFHIYRDNQWFPFP